jgi:hypothetical protein
MKTILDNINEVVVVSRPLLEGDQNSSRDNLILFMNEYLIKLAKFSQMPSNQSGSTDTLVDPCEVPIFKEIYIDLQTNNKDPLKLPDQISIK